MRFLLRIAMVSIALAMSPAFSAAANPEGNNQFTEGEVRKVDKDARKLTIKHGPIVNLDMPAMTMVFHVKDPALLNQVSAGDKIRFVVEKVGGQFTVMQVELAK